MTPRHSMVGVLSHHRLFGNTWLRRIVLGVAVVILLVLTLVPEHERAVATLAPTDPAALGLSDTLGQLSAGTSVFGSQAALDLTVKIGRSVYVRDAVSRRLGLEKRLGKDRLHVMRWLDSKVDLRTQRGGIIQMEMSDANGEFALQVLNAYTTEMRARLASIARQQVAYKRSVLDKLLSDSYDRFERARVTFDNFRRGTEYADPEGALSQIAGRIPGLEQEILAKQRQLDTFRAFATDSNPQVRNVTAEIASLQRQLAQAQSQRQQNGSLGEVINESNKSAQIRKEYDFARDLYYNYKKFYEGTIVTDLTASANIRILEPPYLDPARQFNLLPLCLAVLLALVGLAVEFYRLRPPVGDEAIMVAPSR
jgi:capsule polysaccharide export protein KpsE/RkpR